MTVINIKSLPVDAHTNLPEIMIRLNTTVAEFLACSPDDVWTYWEYLKPGNYAAGIHVTAKMHSNSHLPIVNVCSIERLTEPAVSELLETIAKVIAAELSLNKENIFVIYDAYEAAHVYNFSSLTTA